MDLAGQSLVVWLSPETIERFLGVLESRDERAMASWVQFLFLALAILCLLRLFSGQVPAMFRAISAHERARSPSSDSLRCTTSMTSLRWRG